MTEKTLAIVLAGGSGSRLRPLTEHRTKSALPFGGKYRLIDFTLSNCLHSGLRKVLVLTQYKSHSLQKHLRDGWSIFIPELSEYITAVPPQMRAGNSWYTSIPNAIYQNRHLLERSSADLAIILHGEHIYRMDYAAMIDFHRQQKSIATFACIEPEGRNFSSFGSLNVDEDNRVLKFSKNSEGPVVKQKDFLVTMGVYVISMRVLLERLEKNHAVDHYSGDFGLDVLADLIPDNPVYAYRFGKATGRVSIDKFWRDVDTLDSFYRTNMELLDQYAPINIYQEDWPIRTYSGQYPPARTIPGDSGSEGLFLNSIAAGGVLIAGGGVQHSILFPRVFLDDQTIVENSILFENVRVGKKARIKNTIIDKNVQVPANETIGYDEKKDRQRFSISEKGIVVVPRDYRFESKS
ncbi:MAG: sugar phosphate nucleotidyltransferase [Methylococcales bacterium]